MSIAICSLHHLWGLAKICFHCLEFNILYKINTRWLQPCWKHVVFEIIMNKGGLRRNASCYSCHPPHTTGRIVSYLTDMSVVQSINQPNKHSGRHNATFLAHRPAIYKTVVVLRPPFRDCLNTPMNSRIWQRSSSKEFYKPHDDKIPGVTGLKSVTPDTCVVQNWALGHASKSQRLTYTHTSPLVPQDS
jgi:hypothetical protein